MSSQQASGYGYELGSGIADLEAKNPANAGMGYYQDALNQLPGYYEPWMQAGQSMMGPLEGQYGQLMNNPGGMLNQIGQNYHQSPGFQFALNQALMGAGHGAAAGGMAGSPMQQQQNMQTATQMGNQDYYNWLGQATGLYGQGLAGAQGMYGIGADMSGQLGENIGDLYQNMGAMAYAGQNQQNANQAAGYGGVAGGLGGFATMGSGGGGMMGGGGSGGSGGGGGLGMLGMLASIF